MDRATIRAGLVGVRGRAWEIIRRAEDVDAALRGGAVEDVTEEDREAAERELRYLQGWAEREHQEGVMLRRQAELEGLLRRPGLLGRLWRWLV